MCPLLSWGSNSLFLYLKGFYHEWLLTYIKCFSVLIWSYIFFLLSLKIAWIALLDFQILNEPFFLGLTPTWLWCIIFCVCYWILFANVHEEYWSVVFFFCTVSGFGIRVILALQNEFGSVPSSLFFWKRLFRIGVTALFIYLLIYLFTYLFLAVLGLHCCVWLSVVAASGVYSSLWYAGFSFRWLLLLQSTGSRRAGFSNCGTQALERRLSSCGMWAYLLHGVWDLPGPGLEPMSPALAAGFLTTTPPEKPTAFLNIVFGRIVPWDHLSLDISILGAFWLWILFS